MGETSVSGRCTQIPLMMVEVGLFTPTMLLLCGRQACCGKRKVIIRILGVTCALNCIPPRWVVTIGCLGVLGVIR